MRTASRDLQWSVQALLQTEYTMFLRSRDSNVKHRKKSIRPGTASCRSSSPHETRIHDLEDQLQKRSQSGTGIESADPASEVSSLSTSSPSRLSASKSHIDQIDLGPPIATLRSLGALAKDDTGVYATNQKLAQKKYDALSPIAQGILSIKDAQRAIDIFFDHCHNSGPVLNEKVRHTWQETADQSPKLILAICSIGARFWDRTNDTCHPRCEELVTLLDKTVSNLLLRPTPTDVTLDSIVVLLLYAQWMPYSKDDGETQNSSAPHVPRSRYNEISAGAVLGLAMRYALLMGLDRISLAPFQNRLVDQSEDDLSRLRVWYNLITCNFNLMLTSGFPASVNPAASAKVGRKFSSHPKAQIPGDLRVTGLVELVAIVHRTCGEISGRQVHAEHLNKLNEEMDIWERVWLDHLRNTQSNHNQLPFNSVRWYRLSLNCASLTPLLSAPSSVQQSLEKSLNISLSAAAQILISLSTAGAEYAWQINSQSQSTFPEGAWHVDPVATERLYYGVDSTWISHTFAVIFIVLCYTRGIVNDDLQIQDTPITSQNIIKPSRNSLVAKLLNLAVDIFGSVCPRSTFHIARDFQSIVHYASSLVLDLENEPNEENEVLNDYAFQNLLEMMNDSGVDWTGNLFGSASEWDMTMFQT